MRFVTILAVAGGLCLSASTLRARQVDPGATQTPPDVETIEERVTRLERGAESARQMEAARRGARVYAAACSACHGASGLGDGQAAADLDPRPRDLAGGQFRFRTTPSGTPARPEDLERTVRRGLPGSAMPAFDDLLSQREMDDLLSFLDSLREPGQRMSEAPESVRVPSLPAADAGLIEEGQGLYVLLECWTCHGIEGNGRGPSGLELLDEAGDSILPTDFRYDPFKGGREPAAVARTLLTGLNGTPMPSYGEVFLFAREEAGSPSAFAERVPGSAIAALERLLARSPSRPEIDAMGEDGLARMWDRRVAALAHYVLSLDRRRGLWFHLVREEPEREERKP